MILEMNDTIINNDTNNDENKSMDIFVRHLCTMYIAVTCLRPIIDEESNNEDYIGASTNWILLLMIFISSPMTGNINQLRIKRIRIHHVELH